MGRHRSNPVPFLFAIKQNSDGSTQFVKRESSLRLTERQKFSSYSGCGEGESSDGGAVVAVGSGGLAKSLERFSK